MRNQNSYGNNSANRFIDSPSQRLKAFHAPEEVVTISQETRSKGGDILQLLSKLKNFITNTELPLDPSINQSRSDFIRQYLMKIESIANTTTYSDVRLLNGESGVTAEINGKGLNFVRGGKNASLYSNDFIPVKVHEMPERSYVKSRLKLTDSLVSREKYIYLKVNERHFEFDVRNCQTLQEFSGRYRIYSLHVGLDISFNLDEDDYGYFYYNQFGENYRFEVLSVNTGIFQDRQKNFMESNQGKNINAKIGSMPTIGLGNFIVGQSSDNPSDGIVLCYSDVINHPEEEVGMIKLKNNNWVYRNNDDTFEKISLPNLKPTEMGVGVYNRSGFKNLMMIHCDNLQQKFDSLLLLNWSIQDVKYILYKVKKTEHEFAHKSMERLKELKSVWLPENHQISSISEAKNVTADLISKSHFLKTSISA